MKILQEVFAEEGKIATLVFGDIDALAASERAPGRIRSIEVQVKSVRAAADAEKPNSEISPMVDQLILAVRQWRTLAQPFKAHSADYNNVVNLLGELALYLSNKHSKFNFSLQLIRMIKEVFADDNELTTRIDEYAKALDKAIENEGDWGCFVIIVIWLILWALSKAC